MISYCIPLQIQSKGIQDLNNHGYFSVIAVKDSSMEKNYQLEKESVSTQSKFFSDDIRERQRKQRNVAPLWPLLSFLLHTILFGLLIIFSPLREIIIPEKKPQESPLSKMSSYELQEIDENIQQARENEIAQYLMELQTILHNMEFMKNELLKSYDEFAQQESRQVKSEMEVLFEKVLTKQTRSVELQIEVEQVFEKVVEKEKNNEVSVVREEVAQIINDSEESLTEIEESLAEVEHLLDVITAKAQITEMEQTAEATEIARKTQLEINERQAEARQKLSDLKELNNQQVELEHKIAKEVEYQEKTLQPELERLTQEVTQKTENLEVARNELANAELRLKELEEKPDALNEELKKARKEVQAKKKEVESQERELKKAEKRKADTERRLAGSVEKHETLEENLERKKKETEELVDQIDELDHEISESQQQLIQHVQTIAELAKNEEPQPEPRSDESMTSPELANVTLIYLPLPEAYEKAKELEQQIAERNRDIKATELAINQHMSLQMAEEITDVANTERPDFNIEILTSTPETEEQFVEKRDEMTKVVRETEDILEASMIVMEEAQALLEPQQHGADFVETEEDRLARMNDRAELENEIEALGAEDSQEKHKDLAELMRQADGLAAMQELPEEAYDMEAEEDAKGRSSVPGATTGVSGIAKLETGMEGLEPGNIYGSSGVPAIWGFVNSWYVIGPFDNPNRVNITRKFAPESVVDLDASYVGKGGKIVRWEYVQATATQQKDHWQKPDAKKSMVLPEYSGEYEIWYAYTEIFMEEECDLWLGIGSDDRSDIWINDFKIWSSSNKLKAWRIDEGFRRVHLRKGKNKILARVENGHWNFGWSICLTTDGSANANQ